MSIDNKIAKKIGKDYGGEAPKENMFLSGLDGIVVNLLEGPDIGYDNTAALMSAAPWTDDVSFEELNTICKAQKTGKLMGNFEEAMKFTFFIGGISRACTHQLVRTRVGACMSQESGRVCDWRHKYVRIPRTVDSSGFKEKYEWTVEVAKTLYVEMLDAGVPAQDARRVLPIGITTYLYETINFRALKGLAANRMCPSQADWEINYVMWLIKDTVEEKYPELARQLVPRCCLIGKCIHEGDLFPPCGLFPRDFEPKDYRHKLEDNGIFKEKHSDIKRRLTKCRIQTEKMKKEQEDFESEL
jgi:flavin-dependent thymidylate synthase